MRAEHKARFDRMVSDLKKAELKLTPQRLAIVRLFCADESHPTAQDLYARLAGEFPTMSFATVYNTLDALAQAGLSGTLHLGGASRFDPNTLPHHHAICDSCGAIVDIPAAKERASRSPTGEKQIAAPSTLKDVASVAPGFSVRAVERVYRGICKSCSQKTKKKKLEKN